MRQLDVAGPGLAVEVVDGDEDLDFLLSCQAVPVIDRGDSEVFGGFAYRMEGDEGPAQIYVGDRRESAVGDHFNSGRIPGSNQGGGQVDGIADVGDGLA